MKQIICAAVLAVCTFGVQAQEKKFHFGAKAGAQSTTITGDEEDVSARIGAHVGVFGEYMINDKFSIQPELVFSMQGADSDVEENVFGENYKGEWVKLNYLNLPVLVKYHFSGVKGLSVGVGPQVGFLLSAKQKYTTSVEGVTTEHEDDVKDNLKSIDFGLTAGAEYELPVHVFFGIRAYQGFMNINDIDNDKAYNSVFQLSAGYRF
ncbi:PorT family protein [Flavobacterium sp. MAH-1]|uniref:PorT family protein n=1 Tax=Flavobacterium agri TaxID=2743471 RepID=A0A7Y9C4W2_9FLAO|nr:porin family protein [Flavobacterium agri]NUY80627.1 PorT family protein [Flavobacterium agri]NYA70651.1 PorT family protein [Flavobacterium agri]